MYVIAKRLVEMNKETILTPFRYVKQLYSIGCTDIHIQNV